MQYEAPIPLEVVPTVVNISPHFVQLAIPESFVYVSRAHTSQRDDPNMFWKEPAGQFLHESMETEPDFDENFPRGQSEQDADPFSEPYFPGGQALQIPPLL